MKKNINIGDYIYVNDLNNIMFKLCVLGVEYAMINDVYIFTLAKKHNLNNWSKGVKFSDERLKKLGINLKYSGQLFWEFHIKEITKICCNHCNSLNENKL